jgi:predicted nucleic acid-binding Zn ribbon protein
MNMVKMNMYLLEPIEQTFIHCNVCGLVSEKPRTLSKENYECGMKQRNRQNKVRMMVLDAELRGFGWRSFPFDSQSLHLRCLCAGSFRTYAMSQLAIDSNSHENL